MKLEAMTTISKQAKQSVLFFGSCDFSVTSLKALLRYRQRTDSVIDRIEVVTPSSLVPQVPLERFALAHQLTLHQPIADRVDHKAVDVSFGQQKFDFGVVVSFGHKLSADLIQRFRQGSLNVHPSLLPKYRGAAPLQCQILNGDKVGGVSIISLHPYQFDVGKVYKQTRVKMPQYISYGDLHRQFAAIGASDLVSVIHNFSQYSESALSQDSINLGDISNRTSKAPKIKSALAFIDPLKMSAASIYRRHLAIGHQFTIHTQLFYTDVYVNEILSPEESDKQLRLLCPHVFETDQLPYYHSSLSNTLYLKCSSGWLGIKNAHLKRSHIMTANELMQHFKNENIKQLQCKVSNSIFHSLSIDRV
ncbi:hypothetical protein MIR68_005003 [Amoeboaphelidium protococcarum]|nr:hypothetical protein MIR68_005003 [Amoeboaphelidium protococcarum]